VPRRRTREDDRERSGQRDLARLDKPTRASVLQALQGAVGNSALQRVVGPQLQRDTTTAAKPASGWRHRGMAADWVLSLGGNIVGSVASVEGGSIRSEVVEVSGGAGDLVRKRIGSVHYEPLVLKVGLGLGKDFYDWVDEAIARRHVRQNLVVHQVEPDSRKEQTRIELRDCQVTSVKLPRLGPAEKGPAWIEVTIAPEQIQRLSGSGAKVGAKPTSDALDPSTARFEVSGIGSVSGLSSIAPWTFTQVLATEHGDKVVAKADLGDLHVTLAEGGKGGTAGFDDWVDKSIVKGDSGRDSLRTAVLSVSSMSGKKLELGFSGVGISSAEQIGRAGAAERRYELFVEDAKLRVV
jgi:phage tail-like protein